MKEVNEMRPGEAGFWEGAHPAGSHLFGLREDGTKVPLLTNLIFHLG